MDISEKRLVDRMVSYWERSRKEDAMPRFQRFNLDEVSDVKDFCFVLELMHQQGKQKMYKYHYVGKSIKEAYGKDTTGDYISSEVMDIPGAKILQQMELCLEESRPVTENGRFINRKHKVVKYRACILPLGSEAITHLVVGLSWRAF